MALSFQNKIRPIITANQPAVSLVGDSVSSKLSFADKIRPTGKDPVASPTTQGGAIEGVKKYLKGFAELPGKIFQAEKGIVEEGARTVAEGATLAAKGELGRGRAEIGLGLGATGVKAAFAPIGVAAETVIPGEGAISRTAQGALAGGVLAGPAGILPGAAFGLGFAAYEKGKEWLLNTEKGKKFASEYPDVVKDADNLITIGSVFLGSKKVGKVTKEGAGRNILEAPISEVPGAVLENIKQVYKTPRREVAGWLDRQALNSQSTLAQNLREVAEGKALTRRITAAQEKRNFDSADFISRKAVGPDAAEYIPTVNENGRVESLNQAKKVREDTRPLNDVMDKALIEADTYTPRTGGEELRQQALTEVKTQRNIDSGEYTKLAERINKEFDNLKATHPNYENLSLVDIQNIKKARWGKAFDPFDRIQSDVDHAIGEASKRVIENKVPDISIKELNKLIGEHIQAAKYLEGLNNAVVKGGRLGTYVLRGLGTSLGNTLPGKIAGYIGGDVVAKLLLETRISNPAKEILLRRLKAENPKAYQETLKYLQDRKLFRETQLLLPPGKPLGSPENPIITPEYKGGASIRPQGASYLTPEESLAKGIAGPEKIIAEQTATRRLRDFQLKKMEEKQALREKMAKQQAKSKVVKENISNEVLENIPDPKNPQVQDVILELKSAQAGKRVFIKDPDGMVVRMERSPSTFPEWVPPRLRSAKLFERVIKHLEDGTIPKRAFTFETQLYDIITKKLESSKEIDVTDLNF